MVNFGKISFHLFIDDDDKNRRLSSYSTKPIANNNNSKQFIVNRLNSYCLFSEEQRLQRKINQKIENELKKERKLSRRNLKLLLLGTSESGKSTFIRQVRVIHRNGFETIAERMKYVPQIHQNILTAILTINHAMQLFDFQYENKSLVDNLEKSLASTYNYDNVKSWRRWLDSNVDKSNCNHNDLHNLRSYQMIVQMIQNRLPSNLYHLINEFWNDQGVRHCLSHINRFDLLNSSLYYMKRLHEILDDSYVPSIQDILHLRIPTTGINEYNFEINSMNLTLVDVGGQRTERRKWIHCFESVTTIIYIVALSDFDQIFWEPNLDAYHRWHPLNTVDNMIDDNDDNSPKKVNKLAESKALFKTILTSRWFRDTSFVLFLNKYDLFEEKILHGMNRLEDIFPDFKNIIESSCSNELNNVELAANFIFQMFFEQDPYEFRRHVVYTHFTCATDTSNIEMVFNAVKHTIMEQFLSKEMQIF